MGTHSGTSNNGLPGPGLVPGPQGQGEEEAVPGTHRDSLLTRPVASVLGWGLSEIDLNTKISAQVVYLGSNPRRHCKRVGKGDRAGRRAE